MSNASVEARTKEARERGEALMRAQRAAGIGSNAGGSDSQTRVFEVTAFTKLGDPLTMIVDGQVTVEEMEGWRLLGAALFGVGERVWRRINRKRTPKIIGRE